MKPKTVNRKVSQKFPRRLTAKDICRGKADGPNGTHCTVGWVEKCPKLSGVFYAELQNELGCGNYVAHWNDTNTRRTVAATINRVLKKLGWIK